MRALLRNFIARFFYFMVSLIEPVAVAVRAIVTKFRSKFTLLDIKPQTCIRRERFEENIASVSASVNDDHQLSIRRL